MFLRTKKLTYKMIDLQRIKFDECNYSNETIDN